MTALVKDANRAIVPNGTPINIYINGILDSQRLTNNGYANWLYPAQSLTGSAVNFIAKTPDGSVASNQMTVYIGGAADAPKVFIASPANGATISGVFPVKIQAGAQAGIKTVQLFIDGVLKTSIAGNANSQILDTYTINLDATVLSAGSHTLQGKAINGYNVTGASSVITVNVGTVQPPADTTAPNITVNTPIAPTGTLPLQLTLSGTAGDNVAVTSMAASFDGTAVPITSSLPNWNLSVSTATAGTHTVIVTAKDAAGNANSITKTWNITEKPKEYISTVS